ncbi:MAG: Mechanosensitive channel MscK precursor [candidate division BRC1 bacterium ADurb.BinA364]|nr:MAG: Mechanosensitive channel MscK precursor [candidate division BRC1 bacterium ADurb.BinA364]
MQEFFANFVSGAIILFERPVRVGDIVTVGDISGRVTRINLRATTILDWDRKELIVPNKEFITGRVVNWTLTDQTARIVLPIGVAYGSNIARALELLLQCARSHPLVLQDPEPSAFFVEFGSSSLNLKLFCFLPNRDNYMKVVTELHLAIEKAFQEAGIAISYPQLDVHLDMKRGERRAESGRQKAEG